MKIQIKFIFISVLLSSVAGCNLPKSPDVKDPEIKIDPKIEDVLKTMNTCNKSDSELSLHQLDPNTAVELKDKIENKDIVLVDCEKKQSNAGRGPIRQLSQFIAVEAPVDLKEKVNYVLIENLRTCSTQKIDAKDDMFLEKKVIQLEGQEPIVLPAPSETTLGFSGKLKILLSDSEFKLSALYLNVKDHNNVVSIKYFGRCLKYNDKVDTKMGDSYNCTEAELLGQKEFLLSVKIDRPDTEGTFLKDICIK